jgi:serine protease DegS
VKQHHTFAFQMIALGLALALLAVFIFPERFGPKTPNTAANTHPAPMAGMAWSFANAVNAAAPAIVNIHIAKQVLREQHPLFNDPLFQPFTDDPVIDPEIKNQTSLGSGVVMSSRGYILTNNHVITNAQQIEVLLADGRQFEARVIGADPETDLAVLKIEATDLPGLVFANSATVRVGDIVLAIGNPFGIGQTVTQGIISATGRHELGLTTFENYIQTDAAINPGSSGGALVNTRGELVGINTAIFSQSGGSQGIGFAIPVNLASNVMSQIIKHGQVIRGWLGVEAAGLPLSMAEDFKIQPGQGIVITAITEGSPAALAGFRPGDVLLKINGQTIRSPAFALTLIANSSPGTLLTLSGMRKEVPIKATAEVSLRPIKPVR